MPFALGMFVNVFFGKAGKEDTVEAGVESVEVGAAHVADAWLGLEEREEVVEGNQTRKDEEMIITIVASTER